MNFSLSIIIDKTLHLFQVQILSQDIVLGICLKSYRLHLYILFSLKIKSSLGLVIILYLKLKFAKPF
jgi:hypothetical protein